MLLKFFLLVALHGVFLWCLSHGQACNSNNFICTTCTSLQFCTSGIPGGVVLTCPTNTNCDATSSSYCTSTACTTEPLAYFNCTTTGHFAVGTNCTQYVFCGSSTTSGTLVPTLFECPAGTIFNPNSALCVLDSAYTCTNGTSTTNATSTTESCTSVGRFPNTTDTTCQSYYYCSLATNGNYTLTSLSCPTTTVFNENTQKCVLSTAYTCPY